MSTRFIFRLDAVLQQRIREEQAAHLAVAQAMEARAAALRRLDEIVREQRRVSAGAMADGFGWNAETRMNVLYYLDRLQNAAHQQRRAIAQCEQGVQKAQGTLVQVAQRRRALERLRERQEEEFRRDMAQRDEKATDELVTARFAHAAQGGR